MADTLSNTIFVPTFCIKSYARCVQHQYRAERLSKYTTETDYTGNFLLPAGFKVLTLTGFGYMRRIVHPTEVTDTLFLLPTMLNEVVILGEAPKPGFDLSRSIRQNTAGIPKKTAPVTFDFFSMFDKSKRTPSKKERMMTKKILETY